MSNVIKDKLIDGKFIASELHDKLGDSVFILKEKFKITPFLTVVLVGNDPASEIYIKNKLKAAEKIGMQADLKRLPESVSQDELLSIIDSISGNPDVNGIIVQLPLPDHLSKNLVLERIPAIKDVDGFSSLNLGKLFAGISGGLVSCTALACLHLIHSVVKDLRGMNVVIIGASNVIGKPLGHLLLREKCTVTFLHELSKNIADHCSNADILVSATGRPLLVKDHFVKEGAIVIDVGISKIILESGSRIVGDVDFDAVVQKVSRITPVPGGVGPLTVAYLLYNTIIAACMQHNIFAGDVGLDYKL